MGAPFHQQQVARAGHLEESANHLMRMRNAEVDAEIGQGEASFEECPQPAHAHVAHGGQVHHNVSAAVQVDAVDCRRQLAGGAHVDLAVHEDDDPASRHGTDSDSERRLIQDSASSFNSGLQLNPCTGGTAQRTQ